MRKSFPMRFLVVALLSRAACAQGVQNSDTFISAGLAWTSSHAIAGTGVTQAGSAGFVTQTDYGYQVTRISAVSVLVDLSFVFPNPGSPKTSLQGAGNLDTSWIATTVGLRFMVPVNSRLSFYGVLGGGFGDFDEPAITQGATPSVSANDTIHGVFVYGGGADLRLSRWLSLRAETRDLVSGRELSGAAGPHHILPMFGVAFHF